jgi:2-polyprenyl-6-methoxyphenol hydroxylase-like FAD-dependent oxidoreductase
MRYDVVVAGGGLAGTMAAMAASAAGRRVLLVERYAALGGMATLGLVQPITMWGMGSTYVLGGRGRRMLEELAADASASTPVTTYGPTCDAEHLKYALERQAQAAGVKLLYHAWVSDAHVSAGRVEALTAVAKGGPLRLEAGVFVDATGDADVAAMAGCPLAVGSQGITLMFVLGGIDRSRAPSREEIGRHYNPHKVGYRGALVFWHPRPDAAYLNMTEVENADALDAAGLTAATLECRRQAWAMLDVFRRHVPGFEKAYMEQTAPALGVRETRRIAGRYTLTTDDALRGADFPDAIARCICPLDIHGSDAGGRKRYQPLSRSYGIPYRCLLPQGVCNLLVAGRPISTDQGAHSSVRRMAPGLALGEAAGLAAAMAADSDADVTDVDVPQLRRKLLQHGAVLEQ